MNADEFIALREAGVIGGKVELIDGVPMMGAYPLGFSAEQVRAAADVGVELQLGERSNGGAAPSPGPPPTSGEP